MAADLIRGWVPFMIVLAAAVGLGSVIPVPGWAGQASRRIQAAYSASALLGFLAVARLVGVGVDAVRWH